MKYNKVDLAYAAGIIDGEGSIGVYGNANKETTFKVVFRLLVQVGMVDKEAVSFLRDTFGGSCIHTKGGSTNRQERFCWSISTKQAQSFLESILPFLKIKQEQAKLAIEFQKRKKKRGGIPYRLTREEWLLQKGFSDKLKQLKRTHS